MAMNLTNKPQSAVVVIKTIIPFANFLVAG